ncbi:cytochrome P450 [Hypoxylon crocopeplum]|nr:cytochrome P450 [Hypoxylon crocopeplum]
MESSVVNITTSLPLAFSQRFKAVLLLDGGGYIISTLVFGLLFCLSIFAYQIRGETIDIPIALAEEVPSKSKRIELYCNNSRQVLKRGYEKYKDVIFGMDTPEGTKIVLPTRFIDELKSHKDLSFGEALNDVTYQAYTNVGALPPWAIKAFSAKFNPTLYQHAEAYHTNIREEVKKFLPKKNDKTWRAFTPWDAVLQVITKANVKAFLGSWAADDEVFLDVAATYITNSIDYTFRLAQIPSFLQPFVYRYLHGYSVLAKQYKDGEKVVRAMMEEKKARNLAPLSDPPSVFDHVNAEGKYLDDVRLQMDIQLPLCAASIHTTTTTIIQCLFDLSTYPQYVSELRAEALQVLEANNGSLTKQALIALEKLDSFIKEVQRFCSPDLTTFQRKALAPVTLSNGFRIGKDTKIEIATGAINSDSVFHEDPDVFDGLRAYKKRMASAEARNKYQVLSVSKEDLTWGFGRAACPGRFLAEMQIKMVLVEFLISCDMKMPDGQARYENLELRGQTLPNVEGQILVRPY